MAPSYASYFWENLTWIEVSPSRVNVSERLWEKKKFTPLPASQQRFSLRSRRNLTPASNVCEEAPISLFSAPKRAQEITGNAFRISLQHDWQIDNGFFHRLIMACTQILVHVWGPEQGCPRCFADRLNQKLLRLTALPHALIVSPRQS